MKPLQSLCLAVAMSLGTASVLFADDKPDTEKTTLKTVTPTEIIKNGKDWKDFNQVVVTFTVSSIMTVPTVYADGTEQDAYHLVSDEGGAKFTVPISPKLLKDFQRIGIRDLKQHFVGKTVTIEGYVTRTGLALILSPTIWTYHVQAKSFDNFKSVIDTEDQKTTQSGQPLK